MARTAPFNGLRYNPDKITRFEDVVTPPYDVINAAAQEDFEKKNPYNMIQLDLSKSIRQEELTAARYEHAEKLLESWQQEGVLVRDDQPAIYLYTIDYLHPSGRRLTRKGLVCLVELTEFSAGIVKPHEQTFSGVITDRLRLLDTCRTQFSQVFSLYSDANNEVMTTLESVSPQSPLCSVSDKDGCRHALYAVSDETILEKVQHSLLPKALYIADGHHRYTTALQFRKMMEERLGSLPPDSPYNYIMMYLCPMEDEGLSVLPTHRYVRLGADTDADRLAASFEKAFAVSELREGTRESLVAQVIDRMDEERRLHMCFGVYHPGEDRCFFLALKNEAVELIQDKNIPEPLAELDVTVLSELIVDKLLGLDHEKCEQGGLVEYYSDADAAVDAGVKEAAGGEYSPVIFLMNNTPVKQVKEVADQNLVMPHKSTYFYPKILTGLVMNKMVEDERINIPGT
mgnify:CR=1 FL=1